MNINHYSDIHKENIDLQWIQKRERKRTSKHKYTCPHTRARNIATSIPNKPFNRIIHIKESANMHINTYTNTNIHMQPYIHIDINVSTYCCKYDSVSQLNYTKLILQAIVTIIILYSVTRLRGNYDSSYFIVIL